MLIPSLFGENLLDDFFDFPTGRGLIGSRSTQSSIMHTDIKETDAAYEVAMNLPGFKKEDIQMELKDGYLIVNATMDTTNDTKDSDGRFIRKERYSGSCSRSFYIGEQVTQEEIKAKFENGVLTVDVPKKEAQPAVETRKYISIEG